MPCNFSPQPVRPSQLWCISFPESAMKPPPIVSARRLIFGPPAHLCKPACTVCMHLGGFEVPCESQAAHKFGQGHTEAASYLINVAKSEISLASLDASNIRSIQTALFSKTFLRRAGFESELPNALSESHKNILSFVHFCKSEMLISTAEESTDDE